MTNIDSFWLVILGVFTLGPSIALCIYIYKKDRVEKEPILLLLGLFVLGMLICIPAGYLNSYRTTLLSSVFPSSVTLTEYVLYLFLTYFVGVGVVEEGLKWLVMFFVTRNNRNFNSYFDGVIYAVFVSLGFATFENVMYVFFWGNGLSTAITRSLTAIPGHMLFGVCMGLFYSEWHALRDAHRIEEKLHGIGLIPNPYVTRFPERGKLVMSFVVPVLVHGTYDTLCDVMGQELPFAFVLFFAFLIGLYIYGFSHVKKISQADARSAKLAIRMVNKAYPGLLKLEENGTATALGNGTLITVCEDMTIQSAAVSRPTAQPVEHFVVDGFNSWS